MILKIKAFSLWQKIINKTITISCLFYFTPVLKNLSDGWVIIICSVVCTLIVSLLFPRKQENAETPAKKPDGRQGGGQ